MTETALAKSASVTIERRKRLRRPTLLTAFGVLFLVMPVLNYVAISLHRGTLVDPMAFAATLPLLGRALWLLPPIVGLGLLLVSSWGWWLFLVYAPTLAIYNMVGFARAPTLFNSAAVIQTILAFVAMAYLMRRDVFAPYLAAERRGWRQSKRIPMVVPVTVNGAEHKTINVSEHGCYVEWAGFSGALGDALSLQLTLAGESFALEGGTVRIDDVGVGIAFRNLDPALSDRLKHAIARARTKA